MKYRNLVLAAVIACAFQLCPAAEDGKMHNPWQTGTLANATPVAVNMVGAPLPATVTLKSSDAGRKIEVKTSSGDYYVPTYDQTDPSSTHQLILFVSGGVASVRFTGAAGGGDTWSIE